MLPMKWKEKVQAEITHLREQGIIEPSHSPWASPIVPVSKPDNSVRMCVDYRKLNAVTVADPYHMPLVPALIDQVGRANFLSKIDLSKGFYQVPLTEQAKYRTSFVTLCGKFRFTRMPFGLRNAPATFQRLMDIVLSGLNTFSSAYIDDILIFSPNWEDHVTHCHSVLER